MNGNEKDRLIKILALIMIVVNLVLVSIDILKYMKNEIKKEMIHNLIINENQYGVITVDYEEQRGIYRRDPNNFLDPAEAY